ncbi:MAG: 3-phosphoshikimate 1-carboxyvinyltransferase [Eubacteriales bacterium]
MIIEPTNKINGELSVPGDKSISHRSIMFSALSKGNSKITNFLKGDDCLSTIRCFKQLGIPITVNQDYIQIEGKGLKGLNKPNEILDVGNSGTTLRLLSGILSAQPFESIITGDDSIQKRPMLRIIEPLTKMGAKINSLNKNNCAPLKITGQPLKGIHYSLPVASAQVKSSIMLASLFAKGNTIIEEPSASRNHSEIMLEYYGGNIHKEELKLTIEPFPNLTGKKVIIPGDISSAAYFITAALILPNSKVLIKNVGINSTRNGILKVYDKMNGNIKILNKRIINGEPVADILAETSTLKGTTLEGNIIPNIIDEIPIISVAAAYAEGETIIKDASELKVKESNRIDAMVNNLSKMGAQIKGTEDGMIIKGKKALIGDKLFSHHDHRIAMSLTIAALGAKGNSDITNYDCIKISYPYFYFDLNKLIG